MIKLLDLAKRHEYEDITKAELRDKYGIEIKSSGTTYQDTPLVYDKDSDYDFENLYEDTDKFRFITYNLNEKKVVLSSSTTKDYAILDAQFVLDDGKQSKINVTCAKEAWSIIPEEITVKDLRDTYGVTIGLDHIEVDGMKIVAYGEFYNVLRDDETALISHRHTFLHFETREQGFINVAWQLLDALNAYPVINEVQEEVTRNPLTNEELRSLKEGDEVLIKAEVVKDLGIGFHALVYEDIVFIPYTSKEVYHI